LDFSLEHDLEWLAILKSTDFMFYEGIDAAMKKFNILKGQNTGQRKDQIFAYEFIK
jgi:hypothetical protein